MVTAGTFLFVSFDSGNRSVDSYAGCAIGWSTGCNPHIGRESKQISCRFHDAVVCDSVSVLTMNTDCKRVTSVTDHETEIANST